MPKKTLMVWGGWSGHEPQQCCDAVAQSLREHGFEVEVSDTLDAFKDAARLKSLDLLVPIWTMGKIAREQAGPIFEAVRGGVGLAGWHGGMCDAFREHTEWQFMTGGQWVAHPGGEVEYTVNILDPLHFITQGMKHFDVKSEQYYMHVDPANRVLATTTFPTADGPHVSNGAVQMPVVWTKLYGQGRVAYTSLGHVAKTVRQPEVLRIITRLCLWAAHAEDLAKD
jgi:hypothetical protein